jgi:sugar lactone lactonase YvrE
MSLVRYAIAAIGLSFSINSLALAQAGEKMVTAELFASVPHSVGNITFTSDNRVIYSHHPFFSPDVRVAELDADRKNFKPFPNAGWNTPRAGIDQYLDSVLGLRGDESGIVWMLDMGQRTPLTPKIVGWNTSSNRLERIYYLPWPASLPESQHNDFVVDVKNRKFYIADEGIGPGGDGTKAALVVVDMNSGAARRLLQGHVSTLPEDRPITVNGKALTVPGKDGKPVVIKVGADGIAADKEFEWLYYGPLNGTSIYRVRISDLVNETLTEAELGSRVERYATKPNNGGLSIDADGNLYLTEVETKAVGVISANDRQYRRFAWNDHLVWPDGVSYAPDGFMYVSAAQIPLAALLNEGTAHNKPPYYIFRFRPLAAGRVGH